MSFSQCNRCHQPSGFCACKPPESTPEVPVLCPKCPAAREQGVVCECGMPRAWGEIPPVVPVKSLQCIQCDNEAFCPTCDEVPACNMCRKPYAECKCDPMTVPGGSQDAASWDPIGGRPINPDPMAATAPGDSAELHRIRIRLSDEPSWDDAVRLLRMVDEAECQRLREILKRQS